MATPIQLRRDILGADPSTGDLREGELGYAYASDKLFIGGPSAGSVIEIGGGSPIALLTATPGVATADKAVILNNSAEIDAWAVAGLVEAQTFKTSLPVNAGFVKNDLSGNLLFGQTGEQTDLDLTDLADVTLALPSLGEYLCFDGSVWVNAAIPFNDLSDVVLTSPTSGEILSFTGANWVNAPAATLPGVPTVLNDLTDVDTTTATPSLSDVLTFDGSLWVPLPSPSAPTNLNALTDVTITAVASGEFLRNDGVGQFVNILIVEADISDLQSYSLVGHSHVEADITDLQNYTVVGHTHVEADITDLQSYALSVHTHVEADITDLQNYALTTHTHVEADITDLQNYTVVGHTHVESDITNLQAYLLDITNENLGDLNDVDTTGVATGKHLIFNGTNWVPVANDLIGLSDTPPDYSGAANLYLRVDSGASFVDFVSISLSDLPDIALVDLSDVSGVPSAGQVLQFDGSNWVPFNLSNSSLSLDDLNDVIVTAPSSDEILFFDGSDWVNDSPTTIGLVTVGASQTLTNKTLTTPIIDQINPAATLTVTGDLAADDYFGANATLTGNLGAVDVTASGDVTAFDFKSTNPTATSPGFVKNSGTGTLLYGQVVSLSLDDLTSVFVPTPTDQDALVFVSANNRWEAVPIPGLGTINLDDLDDVTITTPGLGEFLRNDGAGQFVNVTLIDADIPGDLTLGTISGNVAFTGNVLPGADMIMTTTTAAFYFGDPTTDGSWRMMRDVGGTEDLLVQERVSSSWVTKGSFST